MTPQALLLDFDGTLVDTEWVIYQAWLDTYQRVGQDLPLELYTRCIGSGFHTWCPKTNLENLSGQAFDWETMDAARQEVIMKGLENEGLIDGVLEFLEAGKKAEMTMAVVSSSSHSWVDAWLDKLAIRHYFTEVICRGDAPRIKPAPDLFLKAVEKLRLSPSDCLVIEDSANGLLAATEAGTRTWIIPNRVTAGLDFSSAEQVFGNFPELHQRLYA